MARRWGTLALFVVIATLASGLDCGSGSTPSDGGPTPGNCNDTTGPSGGVPCVVSLTGAVTLDFTCTSSYWLSGNMLIGAQNKANPANGDAGVKSLTVTLEITSPTAGQATLVPGDAGGAKPNAVTIFLTDPLTTTYYAWYPGLGSMEVTLLAPEDFVTPDGGSRPSQKCVHGHLLARVPNLYIPSQVIVLDAGF